MAFSALASVSLSDNTLRDNRIKLLHSAPLVDAHNVYLRTIPSLGEQLTGQDRNK